MRFERTVQYTIGTFPPAHAIARSKHLHGDMGHIKFEPFDLTDHTPDSTAAAFVQQTKYMNHENLVARPLQAGSQ